MKEARDSASTANALLTDAVKIGLSEERRRLITQCRTRCARSLTNLDKFRPTQHDLGCRARQTVHWRRCADGCHGQAGGGSTGNERRSMPATRRMHVERAILLVRMANWRFIATQDSAGVGTFRTNAANARTALAEMQKRGLP